MASPVPPYGPPINDALDDPNTKLATLIALRDRARATIAAHGDLKKALRRLEREIERREKKKEKR